MKSIRFSISQRPAMGAITCAVLLVCGLGQPTQVRAATDTTSAATRTAALAYGRLGSSTEAAVAKFAFAVLNMYPSMGTAMQAQINALRSYNPNIKLAQYVVLNELSNSLATNTDTYAATSTVYANDWWVHYADGSMVQWTSAYGAYEVNVTDWVPTNAAGQRWPQWKAGFDTSSLFSKLSGLNYIFNDNTMYQPRYDADLMRIGTNQSRNDATIMSHFRMGYQNYWASLRALNPTLAIMGNTDNDLSYAEYQGQIEGGFIECAMGKSWSLETWGGWTTMMTRYRAVLANTKAPHDVILQACAATPDPAQARYGFASALLENGYFAYTVNGYTAPYWADEFSAPLGSAVDAPPTAPATTGGVWMRHYTNGVVLVNPTATTQTVDLGAVYVHLSGTMDPTVNNGTAEQVVTLPPKSGLVMIKP